MANAETASPPPWDSGALEPPNLEPLPPIEAETDYLAAGVVAFVLIYTSFLLITFLLHFFDAADRDDAGSLRGYGGALAREWVFGLGAILLYPLGWLPVLLPFSHRRDAGPPIVLIHGYLMNRSCMFAVYWRLRRLGYHNVRAVNLPKFPSDLEELADHLGEQIRALSEQSEGSPVTCIAHSMGGLIVRASLQRDPGLPVARVITVGTPHRGSRIAHLSLRRVGQQMRPGSDFLESLEDPPPVPLTSLFSRFDNLVIPARSAEFGEKQVELNGYSHMSLLFGAHAFDALVSVLGEAPPGR